MVIELFENTDQFFFLPAIGLSFEDDGTHIVLAWFYWGLSIKCEKS